MTIEFFRQSKIKDRFGSFLDGANRCNPALPHHCCRHISSRMQAICRNCRWIEFAREIEREHDLGKLALGIGQPAAVARAQHRMIKVDRMLAKRGDGHTSRGCADYHESEQMTCEWETDGVIDAKAQ